ncbi:PREDICTED: THP3 homolog C2A9.11c-like [Amphimedon queenslandica]|uniref:PCI domain-containing protein n=2 Tax=Amphimedon queenslandica TaxID=400682 RepID=A0AAN0J9M9_AMPQE|nr:PREDICTED: THP3 homolog C2A9.11c-like [Amphimedon queenslandica]|eukprot:XP_019853745.1 PREDICTED: THP3 homolog C2A9.11c-like [Amphimedon queenslandica]
MPTQPYYYYQPYYYQTTPTNYSATPTNYSTTPTNYSAPPTNYQSNPISYEATPTSAAVSQSTTSWNPVAWQPASQATPTRGGEWPQWSGHRFSMRGRGRGSRGRGSSGRGGVSSDKPSRWDTPTNNKGDNYSSVPPPNSLTTPSPATPTESIKKTDDANTPAKDWPPGLQEYMVRSFESCSSEEEKSQVEKYLQIEINQMFRDKRVWTVDWSSEPLPLDKLKRQAQKRKSRWDTPSPLSVATPSPPNVTTPSTTSKRGKKGKRGRGGRFSADRSIPPDLSEEDKVKVGQRAARFAKGSEGNKKFKAKLSIEELLKTVSVSGEECDWESFCIEGTSTNLEKQYLRLTSAPDPRTIRPQAILSQSLSLVLEKNEQGRDYRYICEQFKSIRQDLTIQGIRNQFTVQVYESHGRIALKNGDWSEFNQCQSQLNSLYGEGLFGSKAEFLAYKILYHMMTSETAEFVGLFCDITRDLAAEPAVKHALNMLRAWSTGNYYRFFRLYRTLPNQGRYLVDLFIERERKSALRIMSKAYRPTLSIDYISSILSFSSLEECRKFLRESCGAVLDPGSLSIDCRLTFNKLAAKS